METISNINVEVNYEGLKQRRKDLGEEGFKKRYSEFFETVLKEIINKTK